MKVFGTKQSQPSDADRMAAARLSAVAARFRAEPTLGLTEVAPDPLAEPEPETAEDRTGADTEE